MTLIVPSKYPQDLRAPAFSHLSVDDDSALCEYTMKSATFTTGSHVDHMTSQPLHHLDQEIHSLVMTM
jgi:hypothetical protein